MKVLLYVFISFFLFNCLSCSTDTRVDLLYTNSISGFAESFNSGASLGDVSMSCADVTVNLYKLNELGDRITPEVANTKVASNGRYEFRNIGSKIKFVNNRPTEPYVVETVGCNKKYSRMLTGFEQQNINFGTSLISFTLETDLKDEMADTYKNIASLEELYKSVQSAENYNEAYNVINTDSTLRDKFENLFDNNQPTVLEEIPPSLVSEVVPDNMNEGTQYQVSISSFHWDPDYTQAIQWKIDNATVSTASTFNLTFTKNMQGLRTLTLYLGKDDGAGVLDISKPYLTRVYEIQVNNTYPAVPLALSMASTAVSTRNVQLQLATGAGFENCATFSKFAVTENTSVTPSLSDFTGECSTETTQTLNYVLSSAGDGLKTLRLWTIDASNNISSPYSLNVTLDETAPNINAISLNNGNDYSGTPFLNVNLDITDLSPPIQVRLQEADLITGDCQSQYADDSWLSYSNSLTPIVFLVSNSDSLKKVCAWAKDSVGNITSHTPTDGVDGVTYDEINYEVGNPPEVILLKISNNTTGVNFGTENYISGDDVKIEWNVSDVEGLNNNPVSLYYTVDDVNWLTIVEDFGGLTGEPTSYDSTYTSFDAPTNNYFKIKIVVKDKSANLSVPIISTPQNTGNWSVYAGSTDRGVGSSAKTASLLHSGVYGKPFAVNKLNNDVYMIDHYNNILRMDALTGLTEVFIKHGSSNFSTSGVVDSSTQTATDRAQIVIKDGFMYLKENNHYVQSSIVYKINLQDNSYIRYISGGLNVDLTTATPQDVFLLAGPLALDESHSLYTITKCVTTNWNRYTDSYRMIKITQKSDGTADEVIHVAGNCVRENMSVDGPLAATSAPVGVNHYPIYGDITAWDNGDKIYFQFSQGNVFKIVDGQMYKTNISTNLGPSLFYDDVREKVYLASSVITEITPDLTGAFGDTTNMYVNNNGADNDCLSDKKIRSSACVNAAFGLDSSSSGSLFFMDGSAVNAGRAYRLRYVDNNEKVQTVAGTLPFYGDGQDKSSIRGTFSGIYYKKSTEPNQTAYPEGLYFMEQKGIVMGYVNPTTHMTEAVFGSQKGGVNYLDSGVQVDKYTNLGTAYGGGNGMPISFHDGLPYFKSQYRALKVDENKQSVKLHNTATLFDHADHGDAVTSSSLHVYGGMKNFTMKGNGLFVIGSYYVAGSSHYNVENPVLHYHDFATNTITKVMGKTGTTSSPDISTPGQVQDASISSSCRFNGSCYMQYVGSQDRLYFVEDTKLRYIHKPTDVANSTLSTLHDFGVSLSNFIFKEDLSMIFYLRSDGKLYCHDLTSGKAWCNDSVLGPATGLATISRGPNQFTWYDANTLLISNYKGLIYKYTLQD